MALMRLQVWTQNQGITDEDFKDGDIYKVRPWDWTPGDLETKRWLVVEMPEYMGSWEELIKSEYTVGADNQPVIRMMRKYRLNYAPKLTPEELALARDPNADCPIITDRFTLDDIIRKGI